MSSSVTSRYTPGEEIAHTVTHGIGVLLSIAGLAVLVSNASLHGDAWHVISCSIYGATLVILYSASSLYHGIPHPQAKAILQRIDHAAIYLLIAGTYTPFLLVSLRGEWGWPMFGLIWTLALVGIALEFIDHRRFKKLSLWLYLGMGWVVLIAIKPMLSRIELGGLVLLLIGGLFYSLGVIFYVRKQMAYHHAIWHLFVLAGSVFHFFAVLFYVVP